MRVVLLDVSKGSFTFDVAGYWPYDGHEQSWVTRAYMGLGSSSDWGENMKEPAKTAVVYE